MDDPLKKKKQQVVIPDWQKDYTGSASEQTKESADTQTSSKEDSEQPRAKLLEDARRFLADESIRGASRERKLAFLEKKSLQSDEIQKLLGAEISSSPNSQASEVAEMKTVHDSTIAPAPKEQHQEKRTSPAHSDESQSSPVRDMPPIITYPEFLLRAPKPPPLVTFRRLAYAVYALAGVSTLIYGASKYLVQPMLESLTEARHDLAETTLLDLKKLNSKLEANVSHIPIMARSALLKKIDLTDADDVESIDSDPTELFHRDMATQTSPPRSRSSSFSSTSINPTDTTIKQTTRLSSIHSTLSSLNSSTSTSFLSDALKESITEFQELLDSIQLNNNSYHSEYSSIYPSTTDKSKKKKPSKAGAEAAKFKAEIRALKGALLGARQFPVARPAAGYVGGG